MGIIANDFTNTPYVPYNIYDYLMNHNENIFKILKYPTVDCLSKPNLTMKEKVALLWKGSSDETSYNVFFKPLVGDELISETTQMRINKVYMSPDNIYISTNTYEFMFLVGRSIALINYNGIVCPRIDVLEAEILKTLNGKYSLGTAGAFQFNKNMSRNCQSTLNVNNSKTYFGSSLYLAGKWGNLNEGDCSGEE
jgi:hypothetical protein